VHVDALATVLQRHGRGWPEFERNTAGMQEAERARLEQQRREAFGND
jgi:hypothetical protein